MRLSVLDQSPIAEGSSGSQALQNTLDLARLADQLGFHRYWVAEHHGSPMLAGASPEVLIGPIASVTSRLRVGSGGVMLPHYSPFKVAESFSMLSGLFPDRIDLAVGRAAGTDAVTAFALQRDRRQGPPDDFPEHLTELLSYLNGALAPAHRFSRLANLPGRPERPEPWLLGSSPQSGVWAAELGLPYAFADFINPSGAEAAAWYREHFVPSSWRTGPQVMVALWVVCADTDEGARQLAASATMAFMLLHRGELIPVPTVERALKFLEDEAQREETTAGVLSFRPPRRRRIVGTPARVRAGIEQAATEYGADEVMVVTITHDHQARCRSYELLAREFALESR